MSPLKKIHASSIVGALVALVGLYLFHEQIHGTSADRVVVYICIGIFGLGMFLMFPTLMANIAKTVVIFVPRLQFGSRKDDVPLDAAPPGTKPGAPVAPSAAPAVIAATDPDPDKP